MFRDPTSTGGPRYFLQENYVRSPVRESEYGGKGILCKITRMRAPFRATGYESLVPGMAITATSYYFNDSNGVFYQATGSGTLGATIPNHTSGSASYNGVPFSFDCIWQSFFPIDYADEMGRGGNTPCDTGVTYYRKMNPEDTEHFKAVWEANGASKTIEFELRATAENSGHIAASWGVSTGGDQYWKVGGTNRLTLSQGGSLYPTTDNWSGLGKTGNRWYDIWSVNATIQTSDADAKNWRGGLNADELACAKAVAKLIGIWKWKEGFCRPGDDAIAHFGITAQEVWQLMEAHGLDPASYGILSYDPDVAVGSRYGLNGTEFHMFVAAGFEARLAALENPT